MSIYYYFKCNKCNERGGFLSRQMWGFGNFDIIESYKFLGKHITECGHQSIRLISEYDEGWGDVKEGIDHLTEEWDYILPRSDDWSFVREHWNNGTTDAEVSKKWREVTYPDGLPEVDDEC